MSHEACAVCARLPREAVWRHEAHLPPQLKSLVEEGGLLRCPTCERRYLLFHEEERDDLDVWETWTFHRLTPPATRRRLEGPAGESWRARWPSMQAALRLELLDPDRDVRAEAAVDLAAVHADDGDLAALERLIVESEDEAVARVLERLDALPFDPDPLVPLLERLLTSPSFDVRGHAAAILAKRAVGANDVTTLRRLLDTNDAALPKAALPRIHLACGKGFDPTPLFDLLARRRHHPVSDVRHPAQWILDDLGPPGGPLDPLPLFLEDLEHPSPDVRLDAAREVASLSGTRPDAVKALPGLIAMLRSNRTTYGATLALRVLTQHGIPTFDAVPTLVARVASTAAAHRHDLMKVLSYLVEKGARVTAHLHELAPLLSEDDRMRGSVAFLLSTELDRGADLGPVVGAIRAAAEAPDCYARHTVVELLRKWEAL